LVGADTDPHAVRTHRHNLGGLGFEGDLSNPETFLSQLAEWGIRSVDLVAGGVPCQPFSNAGRSKIRSLVAAGRRPAHDPRADLWRSFVTIVAKLRPRAVLMENVPGIGEWEDGAILLGFHEDLERLGYDVDAAILEAHRFRVPQHRARLFMVGIRGGSTFVWPRPHPWKAPTVRQAIGDLPTVMAGQRDELMPYQSPSVRSRLVQRLRRDLYPDEHPWLEDHIAREVRPDDLAAYRLMAQGDQYSDLPAELRRYRSDTFRDKYKRLTWENLSRTITAHIAKDGYWYIHPEQHRTLTIREAARIQTFPDWFRFDGQPSHRYRLIGNAVPPLLAEAIGVQLCAALKGPKPRPRDKSTFREELARWHEHNARSFPWRQGQSPWMVLVAEMCLHRTRADQVVSVYETLLEFASTADAMIKNEALVRESMRSLGLHWRAENLLRVAREIANEHGGIVPDSRPVLLRLPGVGDYVANAVLVFGFGRRAILMDTNTMRVVGRYSGRDVPRTWQLRLDLYKLAGKEGADAAFNFALLDFGALVCTSRNPHCGQCPLRDTCPSAGQPGL